MKQNDIQRLTCLRVGWGSEEVALQYTLMGSSVQGSLSGYFKVKHLGEMAPMYLDIRYLYTLLMCVAFDSALSSDADIKVNPPQNFEIVDPGYLGYLYLQWQPPLSLDDFKDCEIEYKLKYRNIGNKYWKTIITKNLHYKDGFDLNKGIEAKIHTILPGQCANGSEIQSSWSETTYQTSTQGNLDTKIQDMDCIYYNWQYLLCSWTAGTGANIDTNYNLFYWYEGLNQAIQCSNYIKANEKNIGCRFPYLESSDYKDFYICVNGTSESKPIRSSYFIFQLQNIVKPLPPDFLSLTVKNSEEINLKWNFPRGPIPGRCFVYEIEVMEDDSTKLTTSFENQVHIIKTSNKSQQLCFLVRSKVNNYCSDDGIWSEWSEEKCWKDISHRQRSPFSSGGTLLISISSFVVT
ncbi:interleukin-13 receptor subunit alpha-2 isoform X2 [Erinaceus europaeus]|uniref:Interleukin-13 receptor subunit alpha-2 isoform X2 n=1 Tax=Erinaceus europaeus TaxID=9365 RepID=A0ABM3WQ83_ERIEU|nr:interleukin-13 receptor subunit alpha-2 isoform X2 [Erinaceus europaeus]XP_060038731.1 interleukin-13 receptor subunit alpha-2 isoform X2 [Erinaceus europaeus]